MNYPFGMLMPGRSLSLCNYRFGFNGKEKDDEVKGFGNQIDYGMRVYDPRTSRFFSVDPLTKKYPFYTPYSFAGNKPIWAIDLDGSEELIYQYVVTDLQKGEVMLKAINNNVTIRAAGDYPKTEIANKNTGKRFNDSEWGTLQQQYFDVNGQQLDIKRDVDGSFIKGTGEILKFHRDNGFLPDGPLTNLGDFLNVGYNSSVYIGPNNPEIVGSNGKARADYRREPTDLMDAAAMEHDKSYDKKKLSGVEGVLSTETLGADIKLVQAAQDVLSKAMAGAVDPYTNNKISDQTTQRARTVIEAFSKLIAYKSSKLAKE